MGIWLEQLTPYIELLLDRLQYGIFLCHPVEGAPSEDEQWLPRYHTQQSSLPLSLPLISFNFVSCPAL